MTIAKKTSYSALFDLGSASILSPIEDLSKKSNTYRTSFTTYHEQDSKLAKLDTGLLSGLISYRCDLGYEQIIIQLDPGIYTHKWGQYEGDYNVQLYSLAMPYRIIIADFENNAFIGARHFFTLNPVWDWDTPLYATGFSNTNNIGYGDTSIGWICFSADTLITTKRGQVPINQVVIGDEVWTHNNRWRKVSNTFANGVQKTVKVKGQGGWDITTTPTHKFLTTTDGETVDWTTVEDMDIAQHHWATPLTFTLDELLPIPPIEYNLDKHYKEVDQDSEAFWWIVGAWLADGHVDLTRKGFALSVNETKVETVCQYLRKLDIEPVINQMDTHVHRIAVGRVAWAKWLKSYFGDDAYTKHVPSFCLTMSMANRQALLDGYLHGDGCDKNLETHSRKASRITATSSSKALAVSMKLLSQSVGNRITTYYVPAKDGHIIQGRHVASNEAWEVIHQSEVKHEYIINNKSFTSIRKIQESDEVEVFDIEVEDDHSYVADGIIVHNCFYHNKAGNNIPDISRKIDYVVNRETGLGEPYNYGNMGNTDGPTFYRMYMPKKNHFHSATNWQAMTKKHGMDWVFDEANYLRYYVPKDPMSGALSHVDPTKDKSARAYTLKMAAFEHYLPYYRHYTTKPINIKGKEYDERVSAAMTVLLMNLGRKESLASYTPPPSSESLPFTTAFSAAAAKKDKTLEGKICPKCTKSFPEHTIFTKVVTSFLDPNTDEKVVDNREFSNWCLACVQSAAVLYTFSPYADTVYYHSDILFYDYGISKHYLPSEVTSCPACEQVYSPFSIETSGNPLVYEVDIMIAASCLACTDPDEISLDTFSQKYVFNGFLVPKKILLFDGESNLTLSNHLVHTSVADSICACGLIPGFEEKIAIIEEDGEMLKICSTCKITPLISVGLPTLKKKELF